MWLKQLSFLSLIISVLSCNPNDTKCKRKELLVILELYKHYKELNHYKNLLSNSMDDISNTKILSQFSSLGDIISAGNGIISSPTLSGSSTTSTQPPPTSISIVDPVHQLNRKLLKNSMMELTSMVDQVKNILMMVLLSPGKIGTEQLNLILDTLYMPGNRGKPASSTPSTLTVPTVTKSVPSWPTVSTVTSKPKISNKEKVPSSGKTNSKNKKKKSTKKAKDAKTNQQYQEILNEAQELAVEYNEMMTEYRMFQRIMAQFGLFGRR